MQFHSLSNLSHWWEIYAPFQAVSPDATSGGDVHPHRGQVIQYMREFRGKTKQEVVKALHWSPAFLRKAESSPYGAKSDERHLHVTAHLQIPPRLLHVPIDVFLPDPDGKWAALCTKVNALSSTSDERALLECRREIAAYQLARDPNYLPLSKDLREKYNLATYACYFQFAKASGLDGWSQTEGGNAPAPEDLSTSQLDMDKRLSNLIRPEEIRKGVRMVEFWLEEIIQAMKHAVGYRLDQLIYLRASFYEILFHFPLFKSYIDAELGPEKKWEYVDKWVVCALYLSNVQLATKPLLVRLALSLERGDMVQAQEDFGQIQFCLDLLCNVLKRFKDAAVCVDGLGGCIALAKGGMKVKLRNYQVRARTIIDTLIEEHTDDEITNANQNNGLL